MLQVARQHQAQSKEQEIWTAGRATNRQKKVDFIDRKQDLQKYPLITPIASEKYCPSKKEKDTVKKVSPFMDVKYSHGIMTNNEKEHLI